MKKSLEIILPIAVLIALFLGYQYFKSTVPQGRNTKAREEQLLKQIDSLKTISERMNAIHVSDSIALENARRDTIINQLYEQTSDNITEFLDSHDSFQSLPTNDKVELLTKYINQSDSVGWAYIRRYANGEH